MITRRHTLAGLSFFPVSQAILDIGKDRTWPIKLVQAARGQIGVTRSYDPSYAALTYPGGDVLRDRGVCTDVIIRAYRDAFNMDLQVLVHEDMRENFPAYPSNWGLSRPDRNIDHRRVPNLERYMRRRKAEYTLPVDFTGWQAGDLCTMRIEGRLPHIGLVSDKRSVSGRPLVIHNIGRGTQEDDLFGHILPERRFRLGPDL